MRAATAAPVAAPAPIDPIPAGPIETTPLPPVDSQPLPPVAGAPAPAPAGTLPPAADVASLPPAAAPAPAPAAPTTASSSRISLVGSWTAQGSSGTSCKVQLSSAPALDLYRASATGCANQDLSKVNAWDYRDGEVYLYQMGGAVTARLRGSSASLNGALTKSGAPLALTR